MRVLQVILTSNMFFPDIIRPLLQRNEKEPSNDQTTTLRKS